MDGYGIIWVDIGILNFQTTPNETLIGWCFIESFQDDRHHLIVALHPNLSGYI
jgi:hypothetical protein